MYNGINITTICAIVGAASLALALLYLAVCGTLIRRRRAEMNCYEAFIRRTYTEENKRVPILVIRHFAAYIDKYNRARRLTPFRYFLRSVPTDNLHERFPVLQTEKHAQPKKINNVKLSKNTKR